MRQVSMSHYKLMLVDKIEKEEMNVNLFEPKSNGSLGDLLPNGPATRMPSSCWVTEYKGEDLQVLDKNGALSFEISDGDKLGVTARNNGSYKEDMFGQFNLPRPLDHDDLSSRFRNSNGIVGKLDRMINSGFDKIFDPGSTCQTKRNLESLMDRNIEVNKDGDYNSPSI
jgi:hypothetical protein